jgi:hypothetical protein
LGEQKGKLGVTAASLIWKQDSHSSGFSFCHQKGCFTVLFVNLEVSFSESNDKNWDRTQQQEEKN